MKLFKIDDNSEIELPKSLSDTVGIKGSDIYGDNKIKIKLMFAIINMVYNTQGKCEILSWGMHGIGINGQYYNYTNYVIMEKYLFEVKNYAEIKLARRYFKILKIRDNI